jgi:hypothetical protein
MLLPPVAGAAAVWEQAGNMSSARYAHTATLLRDGKVLLAGGIDGRATSASADLYDPATRRFTRTGSMSVPRHFFTATSLRDGTVLVAGGNNQPDISTGRFTVTRTAEIYDPRTGTWSRTGDMKAPHSEHAAALLPDGRVLVIGGAQSPPDGMQNAVEIYDPVTRTWSTAPSPPCGLAIPRAATLGDGSILIPGECRAAGPVTGQRFFPTSLTWQSTTPTATSSSGTRNREVAVALSNGSALVAGGILGPDVTSSSEIYDVRTEGWRRVGDMVVRRWLFAAALLRDGRVLVEGGAGSGAPTPITNTAELFDPVTERWTQTASMHEVRHGHTATLLTDGSVLVAGGSDNRGGYSATAELFVEPRDSTRPVLRLSQAPNGTNSWFRKAPAVEHVVATDASGIESLTCRLDGAPAGLLNRASDATSASGDLVTASDGRHAVECSATDRAGNTATGSDVLLLDTRAPTIAFAGNQRSYTVDQVVRITCVASDALSGIASDTCKSVTAPAYSFPLGVNTLTATATDRAGNAGSGATAFTVSVTSASLSRLTSRFVTKPGVAHSLNVKLAHAARPGALAAYVHEVRAQAGKSLSVEQAGILTRLARALA